MILPQNKVLKELTMINLNSFTQKILFNLSFKYSKLSID